MNYKVEKNAELSNAKIFVTLTQEEVNEKVKTLKETSKEEKDFFEEAVGTLLNECFVLAIKEEQLQIVSMPKVNTAETAFEFVIEVALYPEVKLNQYKGLVVEYQSEEVTPEEVNAYIQNELASKTMYEKSDREIVEENDKIKVLINYEQTNNVDKVVYNVEKSSLGFPDHSNALISIGIGFAGLEVDPASKEVIGIKGLLPRSIWLKKKLKTPTPVKGKLTVETQGVELRNKTYIQVNKQDDTYYDPKSGWICIGEKKIYSLDEPVEFLEGVILVLRDNKIVSFWVKVGENLPLF
jgi:hypothetical protein